MKKLRPYQFIAIQECWEALKLDSSPVLLMASVGSGKSLMLATILLKMNYHNKKVLCLVNNAELIRNNHATFLEESGEASIYCAALKSKDISQSIIFGTPQSILNGIDKNDEIANIKFNMIIVDEAHAINYRNHSSCFMRILRHYKQEYPDMRVLGATGTNFRFKGEEIVGKHCLFQSQVGNITTKQLIDEGYLIKPIFEVDPNLIIDFSKVTIKKNGLFDSKQLSLVIDKNTRLTQLICKQIIHIMESQNRFGVFLFATTKKHALEILSYLPAHESALILGDTPQNERTQIIDNARMGHVRYLVNIAIISVGVDIPSFDTVAYLRPTESLVLLVQTMGRALRLSPKTNKKNALVLDFAGNIERHRDWDDPILLDALKQTIDKDKPFVILCPECQTLNTEHARRCIGLSNESRCSYYFEFKECPNVQCRVKNDIASRHCRLCNEEIINPNDKLSLNKIVSNLIEVDVIESNYTLSGSSSKFHLKCAYTCKDIENNIGIVYEHYMPSSQKAINVFYGQFVRKHCDDASRYYIHLNNKNKIEEMLRHINSPKKLQLILSESGSKIKKKIFC
jgi:DNA repair protein RadD